MQKIVILGDFYDSCNSFFTKKKSPENQLSDENIAKNHDFSNKIAIFSL
jgi:hypothetical protein